MIRGLATLCRRANFSRLSIDACPHTRLRAVLNRLLQELEARLRRLRRVTLRNMSEPSRFDDLDPQETREWLESIDSILKTHGAERAHFLLERLIDLTRRSGTYLPFKPNTAYVNTISAGQEKEYPGDRTIERRLEAYIRWNAMAMVVQANRQSSEYGGHIASYASAATLYEVGFNHFWRAPSDKHPGDMVYIQGHASPGIYARAFLEGRLTENHLASFSRGSAPSPRRPEFLSASVADAGLLAIPDGVDGPGPDDGDLPGALSALPRASRHRRSRPIARSGRSSATARWTSPNRWARSRCRCASSSTISCS